MKNQDMRGQHLHFMGIGGIGMSALAELAVARGAKVSGCDREMSPIVARLQEYGVSVHIGHDPSHLDGVDTLVYTSAIPADHPERSAAEVSSLRRGELLAQMMAGQIGIGICGTHGKTTTTWMVAHLLIEAGLDPTVVVGGIVPSLHGNLRVGAGEIFVAELDESDGAFLLPKLNMALVTNIESEHLHYYGTFDKVREAFRKFARGVADGGVLVAESDSEETRNLLSESAGRSLGYGFCTGADMRALGPKAVRGSEEFSVVFRRKDLGTFRLPQAGEHNVLNALGALTVAMDLGVNVDVARRALAGCEAVERRMQQLGKVDGAVLYSDYAHHPTEVRVTIRAARTMHQGRILAVFQPHLYSRTRDYAEDFGKALAEADMVAVAPIYPAREEPIEGVGSELLSKAVAMAGQAEVAVVPLSEIPGWIRERASEADAVLIMGAGDIGRVAHEIVAE